MILTDRQHNQHLTAETWSGEESSSMGRVREDCLSFLIQKSEDIVLTGKRNYAIEVNVDSIHLSSFRKK